MILTMVAQAVERASRCGFMCSVGHILFGLLGLVIAYCTSCYVMNVCCLFYCIPFRMSTFTIFTVGNFGPYNSRYVAYFEI